MQERTKRRIQFWGRLLFVIYLLMLGYFLFFAEEYGEETGARQITGIIWNSSGRSEGSGRTGSSWASGRLF